MLQACAARGAGVTMACQSPAGNDVPNTMQKAAFSLKKCPKQGSALAAQNLSLYPQESEIMHSLLPAPA